MHPSLALLGLAILLSGCAAAMPGYVPPNQKTERLKAITFEDGTVDKSGSYTLSDHERTLSCKQITGSMRIKILQMRSSDQRVAPSATAAAAQSAVRSVKGGSSYGINPQEDRKLDRARLEALNQQLAAKNCRTFDLDAEFAPGNTSTPDPIGANQTKKSK